MVRSTNQGTIAIEKGVCHSWFPRGGACCARDTRLEAGSVRRQGSGNCERGTSTVAFGRREKWGRVGTLEWADFSGLWAQAAPGYLEPDWVTGVRD